MSRALSTLLFLTLGLTCVNLKADPIPVTWNGSPTVTAPSCCTGGSTIGFFPSINEAQNGPEANVSEGFGTGVFAVGGGSGVASIDTPFSISSEATIELAAIASFGGYGTSCTPISCPPTIPVNWANGFQGEFSGGSEIVDSSGNVELSLTWGGSGSAVPVYEVGEYVGQLSDITSDASGAVDLAAGNYTLVTYEENSNNSIGPNQTGVSVQETLSPGTAVPEPFSLGLFTCLGLMLSIWMRRQFPSGR
jgi:hypothetical protein